MAALPYMQLYVADYLADTMHLSTEEHGAYLLIIFNYWQTGKPIPKPRLPKIARLSNDRWISAESSLSEFFKDSGDEWVHERIEIDLEAVRLAQSQRVAAGKASAEARKQSAKAGIAKARNGRSASVEEPMNENSTNKKREEENRALESKALVADESATGEDDLFSEDPVPAPKPQKRTGSMVDYDAIMSSYNELCAGKGKLIGCDIMNAERKRLIDKALELKISGEKPFKEYGIEYWRAYFSICPNDPHWCGVNDRGWRADFTFVLKEKNIIAALEKNNG